MNEERKETDKEMDALRAEADEVQRQVEYAGQHRGPQLGAEHAARRPNVGEWSELEQRVGDRRELQGHTLHGRPGQVRPARHGMVM